MHQERNPTTVIQLPQIQEQNKAKSLSDREFYAETGSSGATLHTSESQNALPRWIAAWNTEYCGYFMNRFWTTCSRRANLFLQQFKEFGILSRNETWHSWKYKETGRWNETRTAEFVNTCTTLPKRGWSVWSYWWNLFSQWYDWLLEIYDFGIASEVISWLSGISKLESQFQDWSMFEISRASSHNALDQRSWESKVNGRTHDIAIDCGAKRFSRLRYAWCDDCVCIEKTSRQACSLPQKRKCRRAACSKIRPVLTRKTKLLTWSTSISVQPELMKRYKDSQTYSENVCRMTTSKISMYDGIKPHNQQATCLQMSASDCLDLYDQETVRNNGQTSYLRLKTSVKLHIDQMIRTRNFRVRDEVVEIGAVTKTQKGKRACVESEVGECFSVGNTRTTFKRKLM